MLSRGAGEGPRPQTYAKKAPTKTVSRLAAPDSALDGSAAPG
jgi:hypothetical protein